MLQMNDVFQLNIGIMEDVFGQMVPGLVAIPRGRDLYQVMKVTGKFYHIRIMFSGYPYESQARVKMPVALTNQLMGTDLGSSLIRVLEVEEAARTLLME